MHLLSLITAIAASAATVADDDVIDLIHEASETEFGSGSDGASFMIEEAASFGIDYRMLIDGCLQSEDLAKRKRCMSLMLWISEFGDLDGIYAQGHAAIIGAIVRKIGDDSMAKLVAGQPKAFRRSAGVSVAYDFGLFDDRSKDEKARFAREFPKVFKALGINQIVEDEGGTQDEAPAEQDGTEQPATVGESK